MSDEFKPRILGFLCNWCCYAAADAAGKPDHAHGTILTS
ncbi:MAG: hydrogenase iron-sulfur subunit [Desulfobulbaceae bacterium]|nr:hydrogenase iron-sulfur subunit [Desulfobulbaceae bacterium]